MPRDVLIVEDDPIIALDFEDTILGFGVKTVRSAGSVAKALEMIADRAPDFALLDVGLVREKSFAVAERLEALKIPFVFVTGYGVHGAFPAVFAGKPTLPKPYSTDALHALLKQRPGVAPVADWRRRLFDPLITIPIWDRASSTTAPRRRDRARSPSSVR